MKLKDVYLGSEASYVGHSTGFGHRRWSADYPRAWVISVPFGPRLLCVGCSEEEAIDEWDERHGQRDPDAPCRHEGTHGTMDCPACGLTASEFIRAAGEFLRNSDGASAEDPGYFEGD